MTEVSKTPLKFGIDVPNRGLLGKLFPQSTESEYLDVLFAGYGSEYRFFHMELFLYACIIFTKANTIILSEYRHAAGHLEYHHFKFLKKHCQHQVN